MNVEERILLERISSLNQLSDAQRREAEADEYLLELIADNALLEDAAAVHALEPRREALLERIEMQATEREQTTMGLMGLLSGRSFRAQAAIVCTLLLAVLVVSQLLPGRDMQPGASPASHPRLDQLVGYAIAYFHDFVAPSKVYRLPDGRERAALADLGERLGAPGAGGDGEALQNLVYEGGKDHGFENLRDWFRAIYEVLLGQSQGPRFGSFIALYGIDETRRLIARALAGELAAQSGGGAGG